MTFFKKHKNTLLAVLILLVFAYQLVDRHLAGSNIDPAGVENQRLVSLFQNKQSDQFLTVQGQVYRLLPDDNKGSRHQRFLIYVNNVSVLVAHNIDLAKPVPLAKGDTVTLHGEYEYTPKGGVLHWTHHDPKGRHSGGWIEHKGKRYL